jgi:hypothetical protein
MKDARTTGTVDVTEGRPAAAEDRTSEDWLWMVSEEPAFHLEEPDRSWGRD